ncbi:MAG: DUF359 domain-containing protein [Desulfurococcales archaeon]|nr:DUF359 domain-containing protein [Desulfurococcales archaeon]
MRPGLVLPEELRREFSRPWGLLAWGDFTRLLPRKGLVTCVGDVVSAACLRGLPVSRLRIIVDGKTRRNISMAVNEVSLRGFTVVRVENPPGMVTYQAGKTVCESTRPGIAIIVEGEEDMLALPAIACSRIGDTVAYGIPGKGVAIVNVTPEAKWHANTRILQLKPVIHNPQTQ